MKYTVNSSSGLCEELHVGLLVL